MRVSNIKGASLKRTKPAIFEVINYFNFFNYAPNERLIYTYAPIKAKRSEIHRILQEMVAADELVCQTIVENKAVEEIYAMPGKGIFFNHHLKRKKNAQKKLEKVEKLLRILQEIPLINLIGFSGSCTMGNASHTDDVDLFIVTAPGHMWTARFLAVLATHILGLKRKRGVQKAPDKACLNLFFDARNLVIPTYKRNIYTAHEVLQMKPLTEMEHSLKLSNDYIVRQNSTYAKFLKANSWVKAYFPNWKHNKAYAGMGIQDKTIRKSQNNNLLSTLLEHILKKLQLVLINRHKTHETITDTQLWFFPHDFQLKMGKIISETAHQSAG